MTYPAYQEVCSIAVAVRGDERNARMHGLAEIKSWILSMGSMVEVLGPIELVKVIREEIVKMKDIYK